MPILPKKASNFVMKAVKECRQSRQLINDDPVSYKNGHSYHTKTYMILSIHTKSQMFLCYIGNKEAR